LNLGLGPPALAQVIHLTEKAPAAVAPTGAEREALGVVLRRNY
jgi:hypothetical protein